MLILGGSFLPSCAFSCCHGLIAIISINFIFFFLTFKSLSISLFISDSLNLREKSVCRNHRCHKTLQQNCSDNLLPNNFWPLALFVSFLLIGVLCALAGYLRASLMAHLCFMHLQSHSSAYTEQLTKLEEVEDELQALGFHRKLASLHLVSRLNANAKKKCG